MTAKFSNKIFIPVGNSNCRPETENPDQPMLNMQSLVLYGYFSFVPRGTVEYKLDCNCVCSMSANMHVN
jgi:hypothetical protein